MTKSLVLVIGAGASKEVNLPVGNELKAQIASALDIRYENGFSRSSGDGQIDDAFRLVAREANLHQPDINPLLRASWRIRDAMPQAISIDNFIDSHRSDSRIALCGKLAIARCILAAEENSALFVNRRDVDSRLNFAALENTWFNSFFQLLTENCQEDQLGERLRSVAIVSFNYDRCVEHYLHSALQNYYGMTSQQATATMAPLEVFHAYGTVGDLPWERTNHGVAYGASLSGQGLIDAAQRIKTFTEGVDPAHSDVVAIRRILSESRKVAFLGFAFHRLNLQLLFPGLTDGQQVLNRPAYGTAFGISQSDTNEICQELGRTGALFQERLSLRNDLRCADLFREFWRSLSVE